METKKALFCGTYYDVPTWTNYLARDKDGDIFAYSMRPKYDPIEGWWMPNDRDCYVETIFQQVTEPICVKVK